MLNRIFIQNYALIDRLEIFLNKGLQVITGETGTGKSIILGALRMVFGERADSKSIGNPHEKCIVEAEFALNQKLKTFFDENDLDFDPVSIIRREILPGGKSRAFVNDVPVTLDILKNLASRLIDIHSQFDTSQLFTEKYQFSIIDGLSENKLLMESYHSQYIDYQSLSKNLAQFREDLAIKTKEADYQSFLLNELESANLEKINLQELQNQINTSQNSELILENLSQILNKFQSEEIGILSSLNEVKSRLSKIEGISVNFEELSKRIESVFYELKDIEVEVEKEAGKIEINPEILAELTAKSNAVNALLMKHQIADIQQLMEIRNHLRREKKSFSELEEKITETESLLKKRETELDKLSAKLSKNRKKTIPVFKEKIESLLARLGLEKANLDIDLQPVANFTPYGKEKIQLLFQANSGFPLKPIQTAVSGGERSRIMLAIKKLVAENTELPTLILDEIDTGVSGRIAEEMGKVMKEMSQNMQLIVITHLPQVAAKGDENYKVVKQEIDGKTQSNILILSEKEKLEEVAGLLSGSKITEAALAQAKELMKS